MVLGGLIQQRRKRKPSARMLRKERFTVKTDSCISQRVGRRLFHLDEGFMKAKIPVRVVGRVGDQHQMGVTVDGVRQCLKGKIGPHIGIHHNEWIALDKIECLVDAAGRFKRARRLMGKYDVKPRSTALVKMVDNLFSKVRHIHGHLGDAGSL